MKPGKIVSNLKRITSEYIELEDRIRLAGLTDENFAEIRMENGDINHLFELRDIFFEMKADWEESEKHREEVQAKIDEMEAQMDVSFRLG